MYICIVFESGSLQLVRNTYYLIMKRLLCLSLMMLCIMTTLAFDVNSRFGIKEQKTAEGYQQYLGKSFFVRPAYGLLESWENSGFKYRKIHAEKLYIISKIKVKDVNIYGTPNREISIEAVEDVSNKTIRFKGYEDITIIRSPWNGTKRYPLIDYLPIVFTEPFNEMKQKLMGNTIKHEMVKDTYEIVDVFIGQNDEDVSATATTNVIVKNNRTGNTSTCPYHKVNYEPFKHALEGTYHAVLTRVEKPEDATDRYGETKVVKEDGINKYYYYDNIIGLVIFADYQEFIFKLLNNSNHTLKLIWDEAVFVDLDGKTSKVMHKGVKYSEREKSQTPSVIIKGANIEDVASPIDKVYYFEGIHLPYTGKTIGNGWKTKSMLPSLFVGKEPGEIRLMLPIQVKDVINEYTFVFKLYYTFDHPELLHSDKVDPIKKEAADFDTIICFSKPAERQDSNSALGATSCMGL